ncbi:MAG: rRNA pseudouridine synthase [Anaerovibrio sp.]|uniref:pseudouridine synthase n=1 Tax=Anaerovibrio sp. TaxID=1872532 RepID=UPI0025CD1C59|nr:pseudouridine synthase [Anaerovibrio sp.]MCR5176361.1 rRNA pseudouridine synthase [Anaerovibrio sp.]
MERIQKLISRAGAASRREAEKLILAGRVTLNGRVVSELGVQADDNDEILIDGVAINRKQPRLYFLLNKPKGYLSTVRDDRGRRTVIELLPEVNEYIYPIGRLDYDTEGLLLLTNDGELMNGLLHPRYEVNKTYLAKVKGTVMGEVLQKLRTGIMLEDGITAPAEVRFLEYNEKGNWSRIQITIHEGRNRQVRRMFSAVGHDVLALKRTAFAGLTLVGVSRGKYRELTGDEVAGLRHIAGGPGKNNE